MEPVIHSMSGMLYVFKHVGKPSKRTMQAIADRCLTSWQFSWCVNKFDKWIVSLP